MNKRTEKMIEKARQVALTSTYPQFKHGAILVKGNRILSQARNLPGFSAHAMKFYSKDCGIATRHAEIGCILNLPKNITRDATIFVVRINTKGHLRLSKPCAMCQAAMRHAGVKKVVFSTNNGIDMMRL